MCGIAGIYSPTPIFGADAVASRLIDALRHRGPNAENWELLGDGHVLLVSTRLSIVDIDGGKQPILSASGDGIVANGEIYNHRDLREKFPAYMYRTGSDIEPLLPLFHAEGKHFSRHLRGMYSAAIFDEQTGSLVLARDPFGIKPLYYATRLDGTVGFASEPRALAAMGLVDHATNPDNARQLLQMQFTTGRTTPLSGVSRVLPGETLVIRDQVILHVPGPSIIPRTRGDQPSESAVLREFDLLVREAVTSHSDTDLRSGLFLSGGVDSSVLLTVLQQERRGAVQAYTCGFDGDDVMDERANAKAFAGRLDADVVEIRTSADTLVRDLPAIAAAFDDPTLDYAVLPTFELARAASQDVKIVYSGEGGDEVFAGYGRHRRESRWWKRFRQCRARDGIMDPLGILRDCRRDWDASHRASQPPRRTGMDQVLTAQLHDFGGWLQNDLLLKLDRCTMAHGLEGRVPFLDEDLVTFGLSLPRRMKIRGRLGKWLMRRWLERYAPYNAPYARKAGFTVPIARWIAPHAKNLAPLVSRQVGIADLCFPDVVEDLFQSLAETPTQRLAKPAWTLLFYATWHRIHIEGVAPEGSLFDLLEVV